MTGAELVRKRMLYVGVDGCRSGWFAACISDAGWFFRLYENVDGLWRELQEARSIFIDIPIGLKHEGTEERRCDTLARSVLGSRRRSSVFPAPCWAALDAPEYRIASRINREISGRGLSQQSFAIMPKIKEINTFLRDKRSAREVFREVHPEVLFWALGGNAMQHRKSKPEGFAERVRVMENVLEGSQARAAEVLTRFARAAVKRDDVLDSLAAAATALLSQGHPASIPENPDRDIYGLPMEMVYYKP
jgi:predicted RNase H-like nuclease